MRASLYMLLALICPTICSAQHYNVWIYNQMGLDFNTEPPTFDPATKGDWSQLNASVTDGTGALHFYTGMPANPSDSAIHLYDRDNQKLNNLYFTRRNVLGHDRYNGIMIKANDTLFYLFSPVSYNPAISFPPDPVKDISNYYSLLNQRAGFYYSVINTKLNGGKGDIQPGMSSVRVNQLPCVGLTAHMNTDSSWWVVTRSRDQFFSYLVTKSGIIQTVVSEMKERQIPKDTFNTNPGKSILRFSNDGKMLLTLTTFMDEMRTGYYQASFFTYAFDPATGKFSNQQIMETAAGFGIKTPQFRDAAFSPNDSLFYLIGYIYGDQFHQYERYTGSHKPVYSWTEFGFSPFSIQLGQNGRVYVGSDGTGSIIYRPNVVGPGCTFVRNYPAMKCSHTPNSNGCLEHGYPFSRYHGLYMNFTPEVQCDSSVKLLNLCDKSKFASYRWYIYDTDSTTGYVDSSYAEEAVFKTPKAGRYWVKLRAITPKGYGPWYSDTIEFGNPVFPVADFSVEDTFACRYVKYKLSNKSILNQSNPNLAPSWHWYFGDGKDTVVSGSGDIEYAYTQTGTFAVKLVVNNGYCSDSMIKQNLVSIIDAPQPGITVNQAIGCQPLEVKIHRTYQDTILQVQYDFGDGSAVFDAPVVNFTEADAQITYPLPGVYPLAQVLYGPSGCVTTDTLEINVLQGFDSLASSDLFVVSVAEDTAIFIQWDATAHAKNYRLLRLENGTNAQEIALTKDLQYTDQSAQLHKTFYTYQIEALDTCLAGVSSNIGTSILLQGENKNNEYSLLQWNDYQQWQNGILHFEVEAKDNFGNWASLNSTQQSDYQDMQYLQERGLEKCYRIKAFENGGNHAVSFSNSLCLPYMPILWIPNAFSPTGDGLNDQFSISNYGIKELELNIYNLYGELIFQGKGTDAAWDGTYNGKPCPIGAYAYTIKAKPQSGRNIIEKGTVTLVR